MFLSLSSGSCCCCRYFVGGGWDGECGGSDGGGGCGDSDGDSSVRHDIPYKVWNWSIFVFANQISLPHISPIQEKLTWDNDKKANAEPEPPQCHPINRRHSTAKVGRAY